MPLPKLQTLNEAGDFSLPRSQLTGLFEAAVARADPMRCIPAHLPKRPKGRVLVIGAGKASARMAEAVEAAWGPCEGLIITRDGYRRPTHGIEVIEASHPVPDARGRAATERMLELLQGCTKDDFVLALISGGGSSLLSAPTNGITLPEEQMLTRSMLASGAPIGDMNILRKHLSRAKGGSLAAAAFPAQMLSLIISDVPGDDPSLIASGPTVPDDSHPSDAAKIAAHWHLPLSPAMQRQLDQPKTTLDADDPTFARAQLQIIAAPSQSLAAAAETAKDNGISVQVLGDALEGEAADLAQSHAQLALDAQAQLCSGEQVLLLSGGECTVTRQGDGIGGPNAEYCLALACALDGAAGICALACDTDGVDGAAEVAGALIDPSSLARASTLGLSPDQFLANNDSHRFFAALNDQVISGPTLTNVNDFRAILISR